MAMADYLGMNRMVPEQWAALRQRYARARAAAKPGFAVAGQRQDGAAACADAGAEKIAGPPRQIIGGRMSVVHANGNGPSSLVCSAEVLSLDALPAVLDQLYFAAMKQGCLVERVCAAPSADGVVLSLMGHRPS
jgi:hypothetical protein